jgi:glycosyltransferase involved in cell wall biosynthesis
VSHFSHNDHADPVWGGAASEVGPPGAQDRPLRILFATARYLPDRGGTEIHTHEVATRLAERGAEVTVATTTQRGPFERDSHDGPVRVLRVRAWPPNRDYYLAPALVRVIRESKPDIIHCQSYHTLVAPLVMLVALRAGIPYVVTLHSGGHSSELRHQLRPLQAWLLRPLLVRARRLVAVSSFEADLFARRLRLARDAFTVIPSGVELPVPPEIAPPVGPPLILSLGRVESYKGHQRVMEALPALKRARPGITLRVVGSGVYERQLRRLAERLGVLDLLEIAPVPADEREGMARLLWRAGVVASLSEYESQGLAIQEALALGRPLVVSEGSALGELGRYPNVRTLGRSAGSEDVATAILELLDAGQVEPPVLPTWDECTAALLELYEETLAQEGS